MVLGTRQLLIFVDSEGSPAFPRLTPLLFRVLPMLTAIFMIALAGGLIMWQDWARRLAICICGMNVLAAVFMARPRPDTRVQLYAPTACMVLALAWLFFVPTVREEFARHSAKAEQANVS